MSIALTGNESLAVILRLLTVAELLAYSEFYSQHPQLASASQASGYSMPAILIVFLSNEKAEEAYNGNINNVPRAIEVLAQETAKPFVYSRQFHILALAPVIGRPIESVYPDTTTSARIKKAIHGTCYPREVLQTSDSNPEHITLPVLSIMWTKTIRSPIHGWEPNHFVPLIRKPATEFPSVKSYADAVKNIKEVPSKAKISSTAHLRPPVELSDCIPRPLGSESDEPPTKKFNKAPQETKKPKAFEKVIKDTSSKKPFSSPIPSHKRFTDDAKYGKEKVGSNVTETLRSKPGQKKDEAFLKPKMRRKKHKSKTKGTIKVTSQVDPKASKMLQKESEKFMSFFEPQTTRFTDEEQRGVLVCDETSTSGSACPPEKPEEVLPLSGPGFFQWYAERGAKVSSNLSRNEERAKTSVITENNEMKALVRGSLSGTTSENINTLMEKLSVAGSIKQQEHLSAIISLAKYNIENGLIVPTQDLAKKYKEIKKLKQSSHIESSRLLEIITNQLNVVQIYLKEKGYIIENRGPEVVKLVNS